MILDDFWEGGLGAVLVLRLWFQKRLSPYYVRKVYYDKTVSV
jgi:hypothetical protein